MSWRIRYRDRQRPWLGPLLLRLTATDASRAAAAARAKLEARGIHPVIIGISRAI